MPACVEPPQALQKQQASSGYCSEPVPGRVLASRCMIFVLASSEIISIHYCNRMQGLPALV